jgi:hypothetical protein
MAEYGCCYEGAVAKTWKCSSPNVEKKGGGEEAEERGAREAICAA